MTMRWAEPFDQYGGDETKMLDGPWAEIVTGSLGSTLLLTNAKARTGSWSLCYTQGSGGCVARRVFGDTLDEVGFAYAFYAEELPVNDPDVGAGHGYLTLASFHDSSNTSQIQFTLSTNGQLALYRGLPEDGDLVGRGLANVLVPAKAFSHLEFKVKIHATDGYAEVRLNGVTVMNLSAINTKDTALDGTAQVVIGGTDNACGGGPYYWDDMFTWDVAGSYNNDFVGDKKVYFLVPDSDTAEADWTPSTGVTSYGVIDEVPPDDADYLSLAATTGITAVGCTELPAEVVAINAVFALLRAWKGDAGDCDLNPGILQGSTFASGAAQPITTSPQYYAQVFEEDPVSAAPPTPAEVNTTKLVLERTA